MKNLAKSAPPPHSNLSGQHREMFYYCTRTAVFSLFILTIFAHLCLFLIISRHESVLLSYCGYEVSSVVPWPPLGCSYIIQTRPHFEFAFFLSPSWHSVKFRFWAVFFILRIMSHSPDGLVAFPNTPPIFYSQCLNFTCQVVLVVYVPF